MDIWLKDESHPLLILHIGDILEAKMKKNQLVLYTY